MPEFVPLPRRGRTFRASRKVRLGDAGATGRLHLDALARYLQDVANDDAVDSGIEGALNWVVRRVAFAVVEPPQLSDEVELTTFCSGVGSRFAERRTIVSVGGATAVEAVALWVSVDPDRGRPAVLGPQFHALYGEAAGGRKVDARLRHPLPHEGAARRHWQQRVTDLDVLGHANNSVALAAVEQVLVDRVPTTVEVEYRDAVEPDDTVELLSDDGWMWLSAAGRVRVSARFSSR